jgi:hypothetical protein
MFLSNTPGDRLERQAVRGYFRPDNPVNDPVLVLQGNP